MLINLPITCSQNIFHRTSKIRSAACFIIYFQQNSYDRQSYKHKRKPVHNIGDSSSEAPLFVCVNINLKTEQN